MTRQVSSVPHQGMPFAVKTSNAADEQVEVFDEPNLVSHGGLLTAGVLCERIGLWPLVAGSLTGGGVRNCVVGGAGADGAGGRVDGLPVRVVGGQWALAQPGAVGDGDVAVDVGVRPGVRGAGAVGEGDPAGQRHVGRRRR